MPPRPPIMNPNLEISSFANPDALAEAVARRWLDEIAAAGQSGLPHRVAVSGGRIAGRLFTAVTALSRARGVAFDHVHFFWADERCVPPADPESNYRLAADLLLTPLKISPGQIHRLKGELDPEAAAREASAEISSLVPANAAGLPELDVVLLGMGEDGHVASLFPGAGAEVLPCPAPFLVIRNSPKPPPTRLSLSYAAIAAARQTWVLASGTGKEAALSASLTSPDRTPLARVIAARSQTHLFTNIVIEKAKID